MPEPLDPLLYRVQEVADLLNLGLSKVYQLIRAGDLRAVRIGGAIRIPRDALERYITALPSVLPEEIEPEADAATFDDAELMASVEKIKKMMAEITERMKRRDDDEGLAGVRRKPKP